MAYRDDREALLARTGALESELARERSKSARATAEAKRLRRDLVALTRAVGGGAAVHGPTAAKVLPLIVASLVGAATLIGVSVGRVRAPACHVAASAAAPEVAVKAPAPTKPAVAPGTTHLVPAGMGLVTFEAWPRARVWLDGHTLGVTPLDSVLVPVGAHVFRFDAPGRPSVLRRVVVVEGRTVVARENLFAATR